GIVVHREAAGLTSFQPGKSSLRPSPFHGAFDVTKEPAVLSKKDRRLTVNVDNLVKDNAGKYRVDRYTANETIMSFAMQKIKDRLVSHVSRGRMVSIEKAITGCGCNPIDPTTSPGFKYTKLGMKKTDLYRINVDGSVWVSDMLRNDVQAWIDSIDAGETKQTLFNTVCKDELRSLEKVALGKTRVIEAAELDYVVAYRMYMSTIYSDLYESSAEDTGIAVGINPPADGHGLFLELNKYHTFMALDYSRFDGSLPAMLMRNAVEILASLHHDEDKVKLLHETVITSKHLVADEFWTVKGGMPSGSPCTTVLNCLCNLLVLEYAFLEIFGLGERDDQFRKHVDDHLIVVYGDDCIVAHNAEEELGPAFKETIFTSFGMEVTPASKVGDVFEVPLDEVEFLKRKFFKIATVHSDRIAMRLSVDTIRQSLMWMRSSKTFDDQVYSLAIELSAWGEETYDREFAACKRMLEGGSLQVNVPFWRAAWETYLGIVDWSVAGAMYPRDLWDPVLEFDDDDDNDVVFFDDRLA
nr:non-structural protein 3D (RNA-dependent RNA polymerase) [limnipivirus B1]